MKAIFSPLQWKSRCTVVFEALQEKIQTGFWKPGDRIYTEAQLTEAFNVSRSTVREALNLLKASNLIYTVPGLGTFVSDAPDPEKKGVFLDATNLRDVLHVMEFRVGYEPYCAALAAERITREEIAELSSCVRRQESGISAEEKCAEFADMDVSFHGLIALAARNVLFSHSFDLIRESLRKQQIISASHPERRKKALQYHEQIILAFEKRDKDQAQLVMYEHVSETKNAISALLKEK
ncbi:MAG: FadR family transcriptional regulator [Synergistaceae bacterium]|jgi:GntR family transcriptional repressor for pyruvate dehydrogenase complex|nr:FadR family transcriptional regulator [Synergistaceae bacterium]